MANPVDAVAIVQPLDPADVLDFQISLTQGAADALPAPILITGESVASFGLALPLEAVAVGLIIRNDANYPAPVLSGLNVTFWLGVTAAMQASSVFGGLGLTLPIELTITTNSQPPRVKNRYVTVNVRRGG